MGKEVIYPPLTEERRKMLLVRVRGTGKRSSAARAELLWHAMNKPPIEVKFIKAKPEDYKRKRNWWDLEDQMLYKDKPLPEWDIMKNALKSGKKIIGKVFMTSVKPIEEDDINDIELGV